MLPVQILGVAPVRPPPPPVVEERVEQLDEVVEDLLAHHDDGELDAQFAQTSGRVADVAFHPQELGLATRRVAWVVEESTLLVPKCFRYIGGNVVGGRTLKKAM